MVIDRALIRTHALTVHAQPQKLSLPGEGGLVLAVSVEGCISPPLRYQVRNAKNEIAQIHDCSGLYDIDRSNLGGGGLLVAPNLLGS